MRRFFSLVLLLTCLPLAAQLRYSNPVLHQDYSDPDVCRVGEDYYLTASSFNFFPGLPVLHSRDLVNWELIGHALTDYPAEEFHTSVQHGNGVWAPAIRYHDGWFYIFCGDPDRGIFMVRTQDPYGAWEAPVWVVREKGFIDPCPFWDSDGKAWLSHAAAGSRAGLKSVVFVAPMAPDGISLTGPSRIVYDGHLTQPTIEGTKFYKRDGWYYIFAPAGGVATGWQTVLRARHPYGPYEEKIVLKSTPGTINGPHQGAWVDTPSGTDWFLHFQDKGAYGRIIHLQPMKWNADGWPSMGEDPDGDGVGQPVAAWRSPFGTTNAIREFPQEWQWPAVPSPYWWMPMENGFRLFSAEQKERGLWNCRNLLTQKFPAERFTVTARLTFRPNPSLNGEEAGLVVTGRDYASLRLTDTPEGARLQFVTCKDADKGGEEQVADLTLYPYPDRPEVSLWVKLDVRAKATEDAVPDAVCRFYYSLDGKRYIQVKGSFTAKSGTWVGARFGFYCNRYAPKNDAGSLDVEDIRVMPEFDPLEGFNYEESQVPDYTLPRLLEAADGKPVTSVKQWEKQRRPELLKLFEQQMYGRAPEAPEALHFRVLSVGDAFDGLAVRKEVGVYFNEAETEYLQLLLYTPKARPRAPVFLGINFFGNHTICDDPAISLPDTLRYRTDFTLDPRGSQSQRWPVKFILESGYALATFCCEDVDPDYDDGFRNGVHGLLDTERDDSSWGTLAAWAWGLSRALDYLETDKDVDGGRVAVFGHSRMGKTALWAGANDTRFAMVIGNAAGCGGAALSRRHYGETLRRINIRFPHWYCGNFHQYGDNEDHLPFDQHELLALIAPRPLYIESGSEDRWSDPYGEYLSLVEASAVYRLYGFDTFTSRAQPAVEAPEIHGVTGYHIRAGKHEILLYDWEQYIRFADSQWK
jgi:beta-xylosidase